MSTENHITEQNSQETPSQSFGYNEDTLDSGVAGAAHGIGSAMEEAANQMAMTFDGATTHVQTVGTQSEAILQQENSLLNIAKGCAIGGGLVVLGQIAGMPIGPEIVGTGLIAGAGIAQIAKDTNFQNLQKIAETMTDVNPADTQTPANTRGDSIPTPSNDRSV
ncbi:MAG: hypothetical protein CMM94_00525 [Rickettsiales bacterium]|nr:hypothetical protein [Rickettsiales bacterium]